MQIYHWGAYCIAIHQGNVKPLGAEKRVIYDFLNSVFSITNHTNNQFFWLNIYFTNRDFVHLYFMFYLTIFLIFLEFFFI